MTAILQKRADPEVARHFEPALAWLIEPQDPDARKATFKQLKRLYGVRSSVAHGKRELTEAEAMHYQSEAVWLSILAMRAAVSHPDLLSLTDSNKRYLLMLVGFKE